MVGIPEAKLPVWEDTSHRESCPYSFRELTPLLTASRVLGPVSRGPAVNQEVGHRQTMLSGWHMPACLGHSPARVRPHILPDFPPALTFHPQGYTVLQPAFPDRRGLGSLQDQQCASSANSPTASLAPSYPMLVLALYSL